MCILTCFPAYRKNSDIRNFSHRPKKHGVIELFRMEREREGMILCWFPRDIIPQLLAYFSVDHHIYTFITSSICATRQTKVIIVKVCQFSTSPHTFQFSGSWGFGGRGRWVESYGYNLWHNLGECKQHWRHTTHSNSAPRRPVNWVAWLQFGVNILYPVTFPPTTNNPCSVFAESLIDWICVYPAQHAEFNSLFQIYLSIP